MENLVGNKYGKLTVIAFDKKQGTMAKWLCKCDCGNIKSVRGDHLKSGEIRSCGCMAKANPLRQTKLYKTWMAMNARCKSNDTKIKTNYKDKGIAVCSEWKDFLVFYDWAINHGYEEGLTIDRIDNSKGYCPENCRWATMKVQSINKSKVFEPTTGIYWRDDLKKWEVTVGKQKHLGLFANIDEAIECRKKYLYDYLDEIGFWDK